MPAERYKVTADPHGVTILKARTPWPTYDRLEWVASARPKDDAAIVIIALQAAGHKVWYEWVG